jgi:outer membrane protein assembly factor BamA
MVNAMHPRTALRFVLVGVACALLCPSLVYAQWLKKLEPCHAMNEEVDAKVRLTPKAGEHYPKIIIDQVKFDGPMSLSDSGREQLLAQLKQDVIYDTPRWLDEVQEWRLRAAWQDEGFFKAETTATAEILGSDSTVEHVSIRVHINEGLQYWTRSIQFRPSDADDHLAFSPEQLRALVPLKEGELFRADKIRDGLDALRDFYLSHGYVDFVATPLTEIGNVEQRIALTMEVDQGMQYRVAKVEVIGQNQTLEALFKSKFKPGDIFDERTARDFLKEYRAALPPDFSPEDLRVVRNVKSGTVDLRFSLGTCPELED